MSGKKYDPMNESELEDYSAFRHSCTRRGFEISHGGGYPAPLANVANSGNDTRNTLVRGTIMKLIAAVIILVAVVNGCEDKRVTTPDINKPPEIVEQADTFTTIGDSLLLYALASDPDNDPISFHCIHHAIDITSGDPDYLIDFISGEFKYYPALSDTPQCRFSFIACDDRESCDTTTFNVDVNAVSSICISFANCQIFGVWYFLDEEYQDLISTDESTMAYLDPGTYEFYGISTTIVGGHHYCWESTVIVVQDKVTNLLLDCTGAECSE